jgi:hypothetical protein
LARNLRFQPPIARPLPSAFCLSDFV